MSSPDKEALALELIDARISKTNRSAWSTYVSTALWREIVPWSLAGICAITALIAILFAMKYAGSIAVVTQLDTVDHYGQVIGVNGQLVRYLPSTAAHEVIDTFIRSVFEIADSKMTMQQNAALAEKLSNSPDVVATIQRYWMTMSPLHKDGSWTPPLAETHVMLTSVLARASNGPNTEYNIQWTETTIYPSGYESKPVLYLADINVESGFSPLVGDLGGYRISHFSFSPVK
ncbi:MAG: hypothetical protein ACYDHD_05640 [Vulcanimicrobiaceae bacterium]